MKKKEGKTCTEVTDVRADLYEHTYTSTTFGMTNHKDGRNQPALYASCRASKIHASASLAVGAAHLWPLCRTHTIIITLSEKTDEKASRQKGI